MIIDEMKNFSLAENKDRKGFFFLAGQNSSKESASRLGQKLLDTNTSQKLPDAIYLGEKGLSVFIMGDCFNMPMFFQGARIAEQMGICKVGSIQELLNLNHPDIKKE